jgi:hypothetical protein
VIEIDVVEVIDDVDEVDATSNVSVSERIPDFEEVKVVNYAPLFAEARRQIGLIMDAIHEEWVHHQMTDRGRLRLRAAFGSILDSIPTTMDGTTAQSNVRIAIRTDEAAVAVERVAYSLAVNGEADWNVFYNLSTLLQRLRKVFAIEID